MSHLISIEEANFMDCTVNQKYTVKMPEALAKNEVFHNWEATRFKSMEENLMPGHVLYDVGAEVGNISAIYAKFVGPENMCMIESNPDNWQNIYATWQANGYNTPLATCSALAGPATSPMTRLYRRDWPKEAFTDKYFTPRAFRYLWEHADQTKQISLDDFAAVCEVYPQAMTIDVEGSELEVLRGARKILRETRPLIWVSIHPEQLEKIYGIMPQQIYDFMANHHYTAEHLGSDHEEHVLFRP